MRSARDARREQRSLEYGLSLRGDVGLCRLPSRQTLVLLLLTPTLGDEQP